MSIEADIPLVLQQMGRVQKIAEQEKSRPERQQAVAKDTTQRGGELARSYVAETQAAEQTHMNVDKDGQQGNAQYSSSEDHSPETEEEVETSPKSQSAWQGKIIDTKV